MSASLVFQQWARATLAADEAVSALVPAANIFDANGRPEVFPRIVLGEDQELPADGVVGRYSRLHATFHVWHREAGLSGAKAISGAVRVALRDRAWTLNGIRCLDTRFESARFVRDPDGETSHGIVSFQATVEEVD